MTWFLSCLAIITYPKYLGLPIQPGLPRIHIGKEISRLSGYQIWLAACQWRLGKSGCAPPLYGCLLTDWDESRISSPGLPDTSKIAASLLFRRV
ncbi:uncharacterized protein BDV17DRAFT_251387 [Aspergillus undulatus]|uniref:uncharacterized protein n=1 Tax=Aspergillus undulatus TaxID=1810928 RepID=UPI003CCCE193